MKPFRRGIHQINKSYISKNSAPYFDKKQCASVTPYKIQWKKHKSINEK